MSAEIVVGIASAATSVVGAVARWADDSMVGSAYEAVRNAH
jgi:hypothetical protein